MRQAACICLAITAGLGKRRFSMQKAWMIKVIPTLAIGAVLAIAAGCAHSRSGGTVAQSAAAEKDYEELSGTWQLTRGVVNGRPVTASVLQNTVLITDRNTFRFPKASGVGTHPAGHFPVNPNTRPKQVDSIAEGGPNAGQLTRAYTRSSTRTTSVPAGGRLADHGRQNSSRLREANEFFNIGRRLGRCHPIDPVITRHRT
jgi:uncharacterized protein (TIGR03067 family)